MADSYTSSLRLTKPEVGANDGTWETPFNDGSVSLADFAISGETSVSVTAGNVTLTTANGSADQARAMVIRATGTPGVSRSITAPDVDKLYVVLNQSDDEITFGPSGGTFLTIPSGYMVALFCMAGLGAIEIKQYGASISDPGVNSSFSVNVKAGAGGSTVDTVTVEYFVQGAFCYLNLGAWSGTFAFSGGSGIVAATISTGNLPSAILPRSALRWPVDVWVDTGGGYAQAQSLMTIPTSGTYFTIAPIDADELYDDADIGVVGNISLVYPLRLVP